MRVTYTLVLGAVVLAIFSLILVEQQKEAFRSASLFSNNANIIFCFWTGNNKMSRQREECLKQLIEVSDCEVALITKDNLHKYILPEHPLHPAYQYLSETHKADYLRTYFMHFHGGGYSDIKKTTGSWANAFKTLRESDSWISGYTEIYGGVAYEPNSNNWKDLVGNCAYICKPHTQLTTEWYNTMVSLLDTKLPDLKRNPSKHPQDQKSADSNYPLEWNEMLGRIFHKVCYTYKDKLLHTLPIPVFNNYR